MDPFNNTLNDTLNDTLNALDTFNTHSNSITFDDMNVTIVIERRGRKTNTYIVGWKLEQTVIKEHLQKMKKKFGCNGSIKTITYDNEEVEVLHLQGEHTPKILEYLKENGVVKVDVKQ